MEDLLAAVRERSQPCLFVGAHALSQVEQIRTDLGPQAWTVGFAGSALRHPHARLVASLGHARLLRGADDLPVVQPMYLRDADAEINWTTRGTR